MVHEKNSSSNIFPLFPLTGLAFKSEISTLKKDIATLKEEQDISLTLTHFYALPGYLLLGTATEPGRALISFIHSFTSSLTQFGISTSPSEEVDSSTCRGSKKSKKR